jgi:redox-sensitive bicupin YhaK (pirin superfamily)
MVRPGQLNLMTAGHGISHSEQTPPPGERTTSALHGVQLWVALPTATRDVAPAFEHHAALPVVTVDGADVTVVMGSLAGATSPATTYSPLVGAEVTLRPGVDAVLPVETMFEHAVLAMDGDIAVDGRVVGRGELLYLPPGPDQLSLAADSTARVLLIGGEPFAETIVMWWNFVGTDHDEIAAARDDWQARDVRFGEVTAYASGRLDAPALPNSRLRARGRTRR